MRPVWVLVLVMAEGNAFVPIGTLVRTLSPVGGGLCADPVGFWLVEIGECLRFLLLLSSGLR